MLKPPSAQVWPVVSSWVGQRRNRLGGVVLAGPIAVRVVLDAAADLVDMLVGELHDVERVGDLDGVGQHFGCFGFLPNRRIGRRSIARAPERSRTAQSMAS